MVAFYAFALAVLQGITELFPISSLGHTVIVPSLLGWSLDQRSPAFLPFVVVLHVGIQHGDTFNWPSVWPAIAECFGMEVGSHRPVSLASDLPRRSGEWARIRTKYSLAGPPAIEALVGRNSLPNGPAAWAAERNKTSTLGRWRQTGGPSTSSTR